MSANETRPRLYPVASHQGLLKVGNDSGKRHVVKYSIKFKYCKIEILEYMDKALYEIHADICKVFTSPRRLEIIDLLREGEKTVNELVELINLPQSSVSQHLAVLRERGIVETRRHGNSVFYRIADERILKACDLMREFLLDQIEKLERIAKVVRE